MNPLSELKRIATIRPSSVDKKSVDGEQPVRLCNYTDVYYNSIIREGMGFMPATASREQVVQFSLREGDVLITKDSETADDIAVPAYVDEDLPDVLCGYHLSIVRPKSDIVYPRFLYWCLTSRLVRSQAENFAAGITRVGIRSDLVGALRVPVPSLDEQHAVSAFLDAETSRMDAVVERKREQIELLQQHWQSVMHEGVAGLLMSERPRRPTSLSWLSTLPADWPEVKLTLFAKLGSGHTPSRSHPEWWESPSLPWITTGEVPQMRSDRIEFITETRELISQVGMASSAAVLHPEGTVVLCRTAASAGYSAIMGRRMATSQDFATWTCGRRLRPRYLLLCLRVMRQDLLGRLAMGSTHKTIYMPDIQAIRIPLPSVEEQDAIVDATYARLPSLNAAVSDLTKQLALLRERREAVITAAVSDDSGVSGVAA